MSHLVVWVGSGRQRHWVPGENLRQPGHVDASKPRTTPHTLRALVCSPRLGLLQKVPTRVPTPGTLVGSPRLGLGSTHAR